MNIDITKALLLIDNEFKLKKDKLRVRSIILACIIPDPWKLWSEEKPDWTEDYIIMIPIRHTDTNRDYNDIIIGNLELKWRSLDE